MTRPDMAEDRPNAADWRNRAERAEAECTELRATIERAANPTPTAEKADVVEAAPADDDLARLIETRLLGVAPDDQDLQLEDHDWRRIIAALQSRPADHTDDVAVDLFAAAMKAKLAQKRAEGRGGWQNQDECSAERLSSMLRDHVSKGDPVDVANFAMMHHQRGERISPAEPVGEEPVCAACRGHRYFVGAPSTVSAGGERLPCPVCAPAVTFGSATPSNPDRLVGWRTIDSAPKDGSWFLALDASDGAHYAAGWDGEENFQSNCGQYVTVTPEPTHWMPLPAAPALDGEKGE